MSVERQPPAFDAATSTEDPNGRSRRPQQTRGRARLRPSSTTGSTSRDTSGQAHDVRGPGASAAEPPRARRRAARQRRRGTLHAKAYVDRIDLAARRLAPPVPRRAARVAPVVAVLLVEVATTPTCRPGPRAAAGPPGRARGRAPRSATVSGSQCSSTSNAADHVEARARANGSGSADPHTPPAASPRGSMSIVTCSPSAARSQLDARPVRAADVEDPARLRRRTARGRCAAGRRARHTTSSRAPRWTRSRRVRWPCRARSWLHPKTRLALLRCCLG